MLPWRSARSRQRNGDTFASERGDTVNRRAHQRHLDNYLADRAELAADRLPTLPATAGADVHPFVDAYAESLGDRPGVHTGDLHYSQVLETWGINLYDAVAPDLRPVVLHLALDAACRRLKDDAQFRLADWLARIELAAWYRSCRW